MKTLKYILIIAATCAFFASKAQIHLKGYKCKYYETQSPYTMAEMCSKKDTFRFTLFTRDIDVIDTGAFDYKKELKTGLKLCFGYPYLKTKDSLYIGTCINDRSCYVYKVYIPNQQVSISVRSRNNDSSFSQKSKWLLAQIRLHRKGHVYLVNEKGQTCQDPNFQKE